MLSVSPSYPLLHLLLFTFLINRSCWTVVLLAVSVTTESKRRRRPESGSWSSRASFGASKSFCARGNQRPAGREEVHWLTTPNQLQSRTQLSKTSFPLGNSKIKAPPSFIIFEFVWGNCRFRIRISHRLQQQFVLKQQLYYFFLNVASIILHRNEMNTIRKEEINKTGNLFKDF